MPILTIYSHKGGQGVTTIAAALATLTANAGHRTVIIDTGNDQAAVHAITTDKWAALSDYLTTTAVTLDDITTRLGDRLDLIETGDTTITFDTHTYGLVTSGLVTSGLGHYDTVIIDTTPAAHPWTRRADACVLVTRPCYLALRHATGQRRPDHVVVITEPGRALDTGDIEAVTGTPVTAVVGHDPHIARAVDAGTLTTRLPRSLARALAPLAAAITAGATR
jgi:MinD-like ATPase involved in chromosome partitioning or flagellar assembly